VAPGERRLALALDATTRGQRFTVLAINVVYRECAIPVAWRVAPAMPAGRWRPHWERLLIQVEAGAPDDPFLRLDLTKAAARAGLDLVPQTPLCRQVKRHGAYASGARITPTQILIIFQYPSCTLSIRCLDVRFQSTRHAA